MIGSTQSPLDRLRPATIATSRTGEDRQAEHPIGPARGERERVGRYLGPAVYGGLDGIITTFAVVSGVAGASLSPAVIIILGAANLFADGFSMATGAYLSAKSDREYYQREWQHQTWKLDHFPEEERANLTELYRAADYSAEEASHLVEIQTRERRRWVSALMIN